MNRSPHLKAPPIAKSSLWIAGLGSLIYIVSQGIPAPDRTETAVRNVSNRAPALAERAAPGGSRPPSFVKMALLARADGPAKVEPGQRNRNIFLRMPDSSKPAPPPPAPAARKETKLEPVPPEVELGFKLIGIMKRNPGAGGEDEEFYAIISAEDRVRIARKGDNLNVGTKVLGVFADRIEIADSITQRTIVLYLDSD